MEVLSKTRTEILKLIDRHGIMTKKQIMGQIKITPINLTYAIRKFEELGLTKRFTVVKTPAYYITKNGSEFIGNINFGYGRNNKVNIATLRHDLMIVDEIYKAKERTYKKLEGREGAIIQEKTEREIMTEAWIIKRMENNTIPDFLIEINTQERNFIDFYEVELSKKNKKELIKKLSKYKNKMENNEISHVVYLWESENIKKYVQRVSQELKTKVYFEEIIG